MKYQLHLFAITFFTLISISSHAKCAKESEMTCVELEYVAPLKSSQSSAGTFDFCQARLKVFGANYSLPDTVDVVFPSEYPCPKKGQRIKGDLSILCKDTGNWTPAKYKFEPYAKVICNPARSTRLSAVKKAKEAFFKDKVVSKNYSDTPDNVQRLNLKTGDAWRVSFPLKGKKPKGAQGIVLINISDGKASVYFGEHKSK